MTSKKSVTSLKSTTKTSKPSNFIRTVPWNEFLYDSPVKVNAIRFKGSRGVHWNFRYHVLNTDTNNEWIEVYGGTNAHEGLHAFKADEVELIVPKRKRSKKS